MQFWCKVNSFQQPITRGRRGPTAVFNVDEEVERLGRKITLKDIRDDMCELTFLLLAIVVPF